MILTDEKIDLEWGKFLRQLSFCLVSLIGGIYGSLYFYVAEDSRTALAKTDLGYLVGVILVLGTFLFALRVMRAPYKKDMFERRLRNWSMTYSAIFMLVISISLNIAFHTLEPGAYLVTPYMMPGGWLICYIVYSQYTRYCIAHGRKNSFLDGKSC